MSYVDALEAQVRQAREQRDQARSIAVRLEQELAATAAERDHFRQIVLALSDRSVDRAFEAYESRRRADLAVVPDSSGGAE